MKAWQFFTLLLLGVLCLGVSLAAVLTASGNQRLQRTLEARQAKLGSGVLGQQAQQLAGNILQDMGRAAITNEPLRALLSRHGYTVTPPTSAGGDQAPQPTVAGPEGAGTR